MLRKICVQTEKIIDNSTYRRAILTVVLFFPFCCLIDSICGGILDNAVLYIMISSTRIMIYTMAIKICVRFPGFFEKELMYTFYSFRKIAVLSIVWLLSLVIVSQYDELTRHIICESCYSNYSNVSAKFPDASPSTAALIVFSIFGLFYMIPMVYNFIHSTIYVIKFYLFRKEYLEAILRYLPWLKWPKFITNPNYRALILSSVLVLQFVALFYITWKFETFAYVLAVLTIINIVAQIICNSFPGKLERVISNSFASIAKTSAFFLIILFFTIKYGYSLMIEQCAYGISSGNYFLCRNLSSSPGGAFFIMFFIALGFFYFITPSLFNWSSSMLFIIKWHFSRNTSKKNRAKEKGM